MSDPKAKPENKPKAAKSDAQPKEEKKKTAKAEATDAAPAETKPTEPAAPRQPADPRLKVLKKFHGKFLPRGPLRDRHKAIMTRWNSGEDHGGVTVDELKALLSDWRASREGPRRKKVQA